MKTELFITFSYYLLYILHKIKSKLTFCDDPQKVELSTMDSIEGFIKEY